MNAVATRARAMTPHRIHILALAAQGNTNRQIGSQLHVSTNAVNCHMQAIYRALGAHDRAHAVAAAFRAGLVR